ncbi:hydroxyisourate hydrolase [Pelagibius sp. Alg239-R121]|uniref:hydroxyisourate hydrolase n=1 Tax=Pelagibius sp. Alg239-R121 TaxID=2993448 RepID=UPI0024A622D7|nr:hydroxyisourate hydrolase [Pelagibius sp. Alg239-R121]
MARVSSHVLNGMDGTHADGIAVTLSRIDTRESTRIFAVDTDEGGRVSVEVDLTGIDADAIYEIVFTTGHYWDKRNLQFDAKGITREVVLRFRMPDRHKTYHMPVILSPNSYSTWFSG